MRLNAEQAQQLGAKLQKLFSRYKTDRKEIEEQMMMNLRQYRGVYDPDIESKLKPGRSKVYPRDTRVKVRGFVAKMMEIMFPAEGKNWQIKTTPAPTIDEVDLDKILQNLEELATATDPPTEITSAMVEKAVFDFAKERAANMEKECTDQLAEMMPTYPQLAKSALRSGGIYGYGCSKGPMVVFKEDRVWERDELGKFQAAKKRLPRPVYKPVSSWDLYPDLAAASWQDQHAIFERQIFTRNSLHGLAKMKGFQGAEIRAYLAENPDGNYKEPHYAAELNKINNLENVSKKKERRYEVISYRGFVSAHELEEIGVEIKENQKHKDMLVDLWMISDTIIKLDTTPFGDTPSEFYHPYMHGEDEDSGLLGVGLPEDIRDSQLSICATARMVQDNAASVAGPIFEVNQDLLARGKDIGSIQAFKVIYREGMGAEAQFQAVRQINTESHIGELSNLLGQHRETMDIESSLPAWMFGASQPLGEAFRTSSNMSMMQGGASMIIKDHSRAFDSYVLSLVGSLLKWNKRFNKSKKTIHGDFEAVATGYQSLVAKELRGAALDQFWIQLSPREQAMFDEYEVLKDRLIARDLPTDRLKLRDDAMESANRITEAAAKSAAAEEELTQAKTKKTNAEADAKTAEIEDRMKQLDPKIQKIYSDIQAQMAAAKKAGDTTTLDSLNLMLQTATQQQPQAQPVQPAAPVAEEEAV